MQNTQSRCYFLERAFLEIIFRQECCSRSSSAWSCPSSSLSIYYCLSVFRVTGGRSPFSQSRLSCDRRMESSSVLAVSFLVIGEMEYSAVLAVLAQITDTKTRLQKNAEENQKVDFRSLAVPRTISNTRTQFQKNTEENQNFFSRIQTAGWSIDACVCWSASWASFPDVSNCCDKSRQQQASIAQWLTDWLLEKQQQQQMKQ